MQKTIQLGLISIGFCILSGFRANCQDNFQQALNFIQHLDKIEAYDEGIYYIEHQISGFKGPQEDTLNFYNGYFNYHLKQIDQSISAFERVRLESPEFFLQAKFLSSFQYAYSGNYPQAKGLTQLKLDSSAFYHELQLMELSSISLLERDFKGFNKYSQGFTGDYFQLAGIEKNLKLNYEGLLKAKRKSPVLAGILSGLVPGVGKFYVGKVGEGYLTLLLSAIVGLQMREAYKKDGIDSTRFKIYAGIFGALYVANIWGSVLSVKIYREEINKTYNEAILLNMHVPLRAIFD